MKIKVKTKDKKGFSLDIKDFNLDDRIKLNNLLYEFFNNKEGMFGPSIEIIRFSTDLTDEEINNYSNDEIFQAAIEISNCVNKKKGT